MAWMVDAIGCLHDATKTSVKKQGKATKILGTARIEGKE